MVAPTHPVLPPNAGLEAVTEKNRLWSGPALQMLQQIHSAVNGLTPTIACTAANTSNLYTLTPFGISPRFTNYFDYISFAFVSPFTSTGSVTATVVPHTGAAATLNVYINSGGTQAGAGDIVINRFYLFYYVSDLNASAGGFVLK